MTQIASLNNQSRDRSGISQPTEPDSGSQAFRDALAQQSLDQLSATLDPSATASLPGVGLALADATGAPPADAVTVASTELVRQEQQRGIRDRGLDASSVSTQELRTRTQGQAETSQPSQPSPTEPGRTTPQQANPTQNGTHHSKPEPARSTPSQTEARPVADGSLSQRSTPAPTQPTSVPLGEPASVTRPAQPQASPSAARSNAAITAISSLNTAASTPKQASSAQPFSIERAAAQTDRASLAKPTNAPAQQPNPTAQIQRGLAQVLRQQGGTLTMKLTPHELGEIKIALHMQQSRVTGTIDAQTTAARDLLTHNIDALKASLEQRGVTVDRLDVRLQGAAESDAHARSGAEPRHEHAGAHADAGGDRHSGSAGREERHAGTRDGAPGSPERSDDRGAATPVRDDGHGRPDEHAGGWLRLDTTA